MPNRINFESSVYSQINQLMVFVCEWMNLEKFCYFAAANMEFFRTKKQKMFLCWLHTKQRGNLSNVIWPSFQFTHFTFAKFPLGVCHILCPAVCVKILGLEIFFLSPDFLFWDSLSLSLHQFRLCQLQFSDAAQLFCGRIMRQSVKHIDGA